MREETSVSSVFRDLLLLPLFSSENPIEKLSNCDYSYCMAANLQRRGIASFGKRFVERSWVGSFRDPAAVKISAFRRGAHCSAYDKNPDDRVDRRGAHCSAYDKNPDDQVHPTVVPDDVIQPESDKYWAPHPKTGVFAPSEQNGRSGGDHRPPPVDGSVLEEKAWFRPLEDVDKPHPV